MGAARFVVQSAATTTPASSLGVVTNTYEQLLSDGIAATNRYTADATRAERVPRITRAKYQIVSVVDAVAFVPFR